MSTKEQRALVKKGLAQLCSGDLIRLIQHIDDEKPLCLAGPMILDGVG